MKSQLENGVSNTFENFTKLIEILNVKITTEKCVFGDCNELSMVFEEGGHMLVENLFNGEPLQRYKVTFNDDSDKTVATQFVAASNGDPKAVDLKSCGFVSTWYDGLEEFDFNVGINRDLTLRTFPSCEVTFDAAGGVWPDEDTFKTVVVAQNAKVVRPKAPTRKGYKFVGWFEDDVKFTFSRLITGPTTLKAKWQITAKPDNGAKTKRFYK